MNAKVIEDGVLRPGVPGTPMPSFQQILARDPDRPPECMFEESAPDLGQEDFCRERFFSREWAALEAKNLWPKVWQMAAREEQIPNVGDLSRWLRSKKSCRTPSP